jgi:glycerol-3-phosphate acyltransferase PlsY
MVVFTPFIVILISYALGCMSVGYYLVRWRTGEDLRVLGSGATGGRNAGRVLGKGAAIATGIGDVLKGVFAMLIAEWFRLEAWALALVMIAVLVGHVWPLQLGFKGGKGLSAAFGAVVAYDYRIALLTALIALFLLFLTRGNQFFFMIGIASSPLIGYLLGHSLEIIGGIAVLVIVILYAHRENILESAVWSSKLKP